MVYRCRFTLLTDSLPDPFPIAKARGRGETPQTIGQQNSQTLKRMGFPPFFLVLLFHLQLTLNETDGFKCFLQTAICRDVFEINAKRNDSLSQFCTHAGNNCSYTQ